MPEIVEGYETDGAAQSASGEASWVDSLRRDARRAMIRRLVMERIEVGGYDPRPNPHDGLSDSGTESNLSAPTNGALIRFAETVLAGVAVMVIGAMLCSHLGVTGKKEAT